MPRTGRGGSRQGTPGTAYSNRTDLNVPRPVAIQTATGQQYGMATAQRQAQQAVPMGAPPAPAMPTGAPAPAPGPLPGQLTPLHAPSERPTEPVTAGVPVGPGPGPEALGMAGGPAQQYQTARDHVASLARLQPDNDALQYLSAQLGVSF